MAGEISFFELGVGDSEQARTFYSGLFGWTFDPGTTDGGGYAIRTPNVPGGVHGGDSGARPYLFFRVDGMKAALERVRELGGTVDDFDGEATRRRSPGSADSSCATTTRARPSDCTSRRPVPRSRTDGQR